VLPSGTTIKLDGLPATLAQDTPVFSVALAASRVHQRSSDEVIATQERLSQRDMIALRNEN
jgi:hypothetical protein